MELLVGSSLHCWMGDWH